MRKTENNLQSSSQNLIALKEELISLKRETRLMKRLITTNGFYGYYFDCLKNFTNREQAFGYVNELYQSLFGAYRFTNYSTFKLLQNGNS